MKRSIVILTLVMISVLLLSCLSGCGTQDLENLREVSFEGTELTISLGTNKSTGCEWDTEISNDKVIDYSINRTFHLKSSAGGQAVGILDAGFEGQGRGSTSIVCTTPVDWDGTGDGYKYVVKVTVNEDGTIESAEGQEG